MACPYFMPVERLEGGAWQHPSRLPLGAGWSGHCTAPGHEGESPSRVVLESCCNLGYAKSCSWAPADRTSDSLRFAALASRDATAQSIRLCCVSERDHRPVERGEVEFDLHQRAWLRTHTDARVQRMAECFLEAHLKKQA